MTKSIKKKIWMGIGILAVLVFAFFFAKVNFFSVFPFSGTGYSAYSLDDSTNKLTYSSIVSQNLGSELLTTAHLYYPFRVETADIMTNNPNYQNWISSNGGVSNMLKDMTCKIYGSTTAGSEEYPSKGRFTVSIPYDITGTVEFSDGAFVCIVPEQDAMFKQALELQPAGLNAQVRYLYIQGKADFVYNEKVCNENELRCNGNYVEDCRNNLWTTQTFCEYGCGNNVCLSNSEVPINNSGGNDNTPVNDTVISCIERDYRCSNGNMQICKSNVFEFKYKCETGCKDTLMCNAFDGKKSYEKPAIIVLLSLVGIIVLTFMIKLRRRK